MGDPREPVRVFRGVMLDVEMVRNLLLEAGIDARLEGEHMGWLDPSISGGLGQMAWVVVPREDAARAERVIASVQR